MARVGCLSLTFALFLLSLVLLIVGKWWIQHDQAFVLGMFRAGSWVLLLGLAALLLSVIFAVVGFGRELREYASNKKMVAQQEVLAASELARKAGLEADVIEFDAGMRITVADGGAQVHAAIRPGFDVDFRALHLSASSDEQSDEEAARWLVWRRTQHGRVSAAPGQFPALPGAGLPGMMDELAGFERALVVGDPGSGKTTVLRYLMASWDGEVVVIDPHDDRNTWPSGIEVIGGGLRFEAIAEALAQYADEIRQRYELRYQQGGTAGFEPKLLVIDEWFDIWRERPDTAEHWQRIGTAGRKVEFGVAVGSHSGQVKPLGLDGAGDVRKMFWKVATSGGEKRGWFRVTVDRGDGEKEVQPPGPWGGVAVSSPAQRGMAWLPDDDLPIQMAPGLSAEEVKVLEMWDGGERRITVIGRVVFGGGRSKGGEQNALTREVLRSHGRL